MKKIIRIGNIEYNEDDSIVCYFRNQYYGKEDEMKHQGWKFDSDGNAFKDNITVYSSCFENEYCQMCIGYVKWTGCGDEFDVMSIDTRCFDLDSEDFMDFKNVLNIIKENHR